MRGAWQRYAMILNSFSRRNIPRRARPHNRQCTLVTNDADPPLSPRMSFAHSAFQRPIPPSFARHQLDHRWHPESRIHPPTFDNNFTRNQKLVVYQSKKLFNRWEHSILLDIIFICSAQANITSSLVKRRHARNHSADQ